MNRYTEIDWKIKYLGMLNVYLYSVGCITDFSSISRNPKIMIALEMKALTHLCLATVYIKCA